MGVLQVQRSVFDILAIGYDRSWPVRDEIDIGRGESAPVCNVVAAFLKVDKSPRSKNAGGKYSCPITLSAAIRKAVTRQIGFRWRR